MVSMLINATHSEDELRVAMVEKGRLIDLDIEYPGSNLKKSNIYKGKISSIEPSLGAVFVDYGVERHGFLPLKEISKEYFLGSKNIDFHNVDIREVLKLGQEIVIQVEKEERGNKGAALTTFISLAGSFLVLMPNNPRAGGISRRIEGEEREQIREAISNLDVPEGMGVIVRTAGLGRNKQELDWDLKTLLHYWEAIKAAATARPGPYLIHQESDVVIRAIRDYLRQDVEEILIDHQETFERAKQYISKIRPNFINQLKQYSNPLPLFSSFQIEQQIEQAFQGEIRLPSGGSIVIDHTEALVAIDINSARATKGSSIEETALNTNLEAAREIPRQLRLRDLGGLIVIDFIDMLSNSNQRAVESELYKFVKQDRARIQIGKISQFGLLEMSRQRMASSLSRNTKQTCPRCNGHGSIRNIEPLALSILRLIEEQSIKAGSAHIQVQLPIDVATYVLNEKRDMLHQIKHISSANVVIIPNQHLQSPHYILKLVKDDRGKNTASYNQVKQPSKADLNKKASKPVEIDIPAINQFLDNSTTTKAPSVKKPHGESLIKRIWDSLFGLNAPTAPPEKQPAKGTRRPSQQGRRSNNRHRSQTSRARNTGTSASRSTQKPRTSNDEGQSNARRGNRGGQSASGQTRRASGNRRRAPEKAKAADKQNKPATQGRKTESKPKQTRAKQNTPPKAPRKQSTDTAQSKPKKVVDIPKSNHQSQLPLQPEVMQTNKSSSAVKPAGTVRPSQPPPTQPKVATQPPVKTEQIDTTTAASHTKEDSPKQKRTANIKATPADYLGQASSSKTEDALQQVKTKKQTHHDE